MLKGRVGSNDNLLPFREKGNSAFFPKWRFKTWSHSPQVAEKYKKRESLLYVKAGYDQGYREELYMKRKPNHILKKD